MTRFVVCIAVAPPPPRRKFEIIFALRRIGILAGFAVCILTLAAPDAQAQTSCDAGERSVAAIITGCVSNADADIADACIAADWTLSGYPPNNLACRVLVRLYNKDGGSNFSRGCAIVEPSSFPSCRLMFGDPSQFPNTDSAATDTRIFVANCSRDGTIPNTIPATINTIGATACTCDSSIGGVTGAWPNCACPTGQGVLANRVCGACASGEGVLDNGACGACTGGEGVLANGYCGVCPAGGIPINGVCTCPDGEGRRDDNTCGACPAGRILQNGICTSCPTGQGVLASGVCGVCTGGEGVLANGACGVCTGGQSVQDGVCQCPAGKIFTDGNCVTPTPAQKCTLAGWTYDPYTDPTFISLSGEGDCDIPTVNSKTGNSSRACDINSPESNSRRCVIIFGPDYDFPKRPSDGSKPTYVYNCDPDDETGLIPATVNTIGATSCACPAGGSVVNGVCACPTGQAVEGDACAACTGGRVVIEGACACPTGGVLFNGVCTCPDGQGVRDDNTCGACPTGQIIQDGICAACPTGQGILADGSCGACTGGQEVQNGVCACPTAGHELQNGTCAPTTEYLCDTSKLWSYDPSDDSCGIKVTLSGSGTVSAECYMSGSQSPQCADIFGSLEDIPQYDGFVDPIPGSDIPFIYNCDPDGDNGLIPATINTIGATTCECPALDQELNGDGVCAPIQCVEGQKLFVEDDIADCYDAEIVDIAEDCRAKDWNMRVSRLAPVKLYCNIPFIRYFASGRNGRDTSCIINPRESSPAANKCRDLFGNPPQFPTATGDFTEDAKPYVTHCNTEGTIPGAIPATINLTGAKECSCDSAAGFVGEHPNCACLTGQGVQDGVCAACPTGQGVLADGTCGVCTGGEGILADQTCGACPAGAAAVSGVCRCSVGQGGGLRADNTCGACPVGQEPIDGVCLAGAGRGLCVTVGWSFSADAGGSCGVLLTLAGGAASDRCYVSGAAKPQCEEVFGSTVNYFPAPTVAADGTTLRFVYNCDPDGENGLIPAMANTIAATECGCGSGASLFNDVCIREEGDLGLADEVLCGVFGGTVQTATGGDVCSGMDANDTFCIMDSAVGFPCRGLFKHLQSCNLQFNRKALNPFFCGEKCGNMEAVGKDCVSL